MEENTNESPPTPPPPDESMAQYRHLLDEVDRANRDMASANARRVKALDDFRRYIEQQAETRPNSGSAHGWTPAVCAEQEMLLELVGVLKVSENTVRNLLYESEILVGRLAPTLHTVDEGEISYPHARVIVDNATSLPDELFDDFERIVLPQAKELTVPQLRKVAKRARERLCPESSEKRHDAALDTRTVWLEPGDDGMSMLGATLSAEIAAGIYDRLTSIALGLGVGDTGDSDTEPDKRTLAQKRADAFADLLLTGDTCDATTEGTGGERANVGHGILPRVLVTVPVLTLLGKSEMPGTLEGYGPIDPATARDLAAHAPSFTRILVHPVSSAILDYDRTTYAVPADLKTVLRVRDEHCRTIGCSRPPSETDQDHTKEWQDGGKTALDNLTLQCRPHHRVKTHTRVRLRTLAGGELEMTTPSGRVYLTRPATRLDQLMKRK
jgi:hypothetical protein